MSICFKSEGISIPHMVSYNFGSYSVLQEEQSDLPVLGTKKAPVFSL